MRTTIVKWVSIVALLLAVVFCNSAATYQLALNVLVSMAVVVVVTLQAVQEKKRRWAAASLAVALLFNPAVPVFHLAGGLSLLA